MSSEKKKRPGRYGPKKTYISSELEAMINYKTSISDKPQRAEQESRRPASSKREDKES